MVMNGARLRALRLCSRRATISFPTPLSPVIRTFASLRAAEASECRRVRILRVGAGRRVRNHDRAHALRRRMAPRTLVFLSAPLDDLVLPFAYATPPD